VPDFAGQLADALGEARGPGRSAIRRAARVLGELALRLAGRETMRVLAAGGLATVDGARPRTPGGVLLRLLREGATDQERRRIFGAGAAPPTTYQSDPAFRVQLRRAVASEQEEPT
jgi:hypothetical protein